MQLVLSVHLQQRLHELLGGALHGPDRPDCVQGQRVSAGPRRPAGQHELKCCDVHDVRGGTFLRHRHWRRCVPGVPVGQVVGTGRRQLHSVRGRTRQQCDGRYIRGHVHSVRGGAFLGHQRWRELMSGVRFGKDVGGGRGQL